MDPPPVPGGGSGTNTGVANVDNGTSEAIVPVAVTFIDVAVPPDVNPVGTLRFNVYAPATGVSRKSVNPSGYPRNPDGNVPSRTF